MNQSFGELLRSKRTISGYTLREFCNRFGFDSAYISRLETEKLKPPSGDKLAIIAESLGMEKNSREWVTFFDAAFKAKNEIPDDIKRGANQAIQILPAFLRTADGKKVSKEKVEELIKFLSRHDKTK